MCLYKSTKIKILTLHKSLANSQKNNWSNQIYHIKSVTTITKTNDPFKQPWQGCEMKRYITSTSFFFLKQLKLWVFGPWLSLLVCPWPSQPSWGGSEQKITKHMLKTPPKNAKKIVCLSLVWSVWSTMKLKCAARSSVHLGTIKVRHCQKRLKELSKTSSSGSSLPLWSSRFLRKLGAMHLEKKTCRNGPIDSSVRPALNPPSCCAHFAWAHLCRRFSSSGRSWVGPSYAAEELLVAWFRTTLAQS